MNKRSFWCALLMASLLLLFSLPASLFAQVDRGTINGTIKDQSGAVIPGVTVTATNVDTGVAAIATTNSIGFYSILNLPMGRYSLKVSKQGFRELERKGITISVAQVAEVNLALAVGSTSEVVTVTDDAPVVETETSDVASDIKGTTLTDLPMSAAGGRDVENFVFATMPGVEGSWWMADINGTQAFTKDVKIDGVSLTSTITGDQGETGPSMEAVEELNVQTSGLGADNASTTGGVEMFTLKSGTNVFHGSAFGYGHNEFLDANSWYNPQHTAKPKARFWDWGFSGGGPIWIPKLYNGRNKTFIFGAFEKYQQSDFTNGGLGPTVPTPAFLTGDFSALITAGNNAVLGTDGAGNTIYKGSIFDPTTGNVFLGNKIPSCPAEQGFAADHGHLPEVLCAIDDIREPERTDRRGELAFANPPSVHLPNGPQLLGEKPYLRRFHPRLHAPPAGRQQLSVAARQHGWRAARQQPFANRARLLLPRQRFAHLHA